MNNSFLANKFRRCVPAIIAWAIMTVLLCCIPVVPASAASSNTKTTESASKTKNEPQTTVKKKTIYKGNTYKIKFNTSIKGYTVKYTSSNKKVATVSSKGKITAKKVGTAKITVTLSKKNTTSKFVIKVTVKKKKKTTQPVTDTENSSSADTTEDGKTDTENSGESGADTGNDGTDTDGDNNTDDTPQLQELIISKSLGFDYVERDIGLYKNWEGVTNISQFVGTNGEAAFALDMEDFVAVFEKQNGEYVNTVNLVKSEPIFGAVTADRLGNYYVVTGCENVTGCPSDTIYLTKYNSEGQIIGTTCDNGRSSLADYYPDEYANAVPFRGGNCTVAYNGGVIAVHYAREMISGHQSDSLWVVDAFNLNTINVGAVYQSHSFAQRVVPTSNGFLLASEGDCYDRAFVVYDVANLNVDLEEQIFHFAYKDGERNDMSLLNNNYAHLGDVVALPNLHAAFVGTSARSLSDDAKTETEDLFIQIFDTTGNLSFPESYVTTGERTGTGMLSDTETTVTDYGVLWLTEGEDVSSPHAVATEDGKIVILYEKYDLTTGRYLGVCRQIIGSDATVLEGETLISTVATLPPSETPICIGKTVTWFGNTSTGTNELCEFTFTLD